jgi:hypothetical protein
LGKVAGADCKVFTMRQEKIIFLIIASRMDVFGVPSSKAIGTMTNQQLLETRQQLAFISNIVAWK